MEAGDREDRNLQPDAELIACGHGPILQHVAAGLKPGPTRKERDKRDGERAGRRARRKINIRRMGKGEPLLLLHGARGLNGEEPGLDALAGHFDVIAPTTLDWPL